MAATGQAPACWTLWGKLPPEGIPAILHPVKAKILAWLAAILTVLFGISLMQSRRRRHDRTAIVKRLEARREMVHADMMSNERLRSEALTKATEARRAGHEAEKSMEVIDARIESRSARRDALLVKLGYRPIDD